MNMLEIYLKWYCFISFDDIYQKHIKLARSKGSNNGYYLKYIHFDCIRVIFMENLKTTKARDYG